MLKYILLMALSVSQCYGMVQDDNNVIIELIHDKEQLQKGLNLCFSSFDALYQKEGGLTKEKENAIKEQRKNRLEQLLSIPNRKDVFVKENKEIIGFLASRLDTNDFKRVIFDNAFLGKSEKVSLVYQALLGYVKQAYPEADKIWLALVKSNITTALAENYGFTKSDYMDQFHQKDKDVWQGWERKINIEQ